MYGLGINIGASSVKVALTNGPELVWDRVMAHEGDFRATLKTILLAEDIPEDVRAIATGTEGRHLLNVHAVLESVCIEEALKNLDFDVDAVVSLGGENFVTYTIDRDRKIITSFSGNKCASGTGEFFKQQLGRMDMTLDQISEISDEARVYPLSSRCSVFMKSDCTHKLNKGEATKADIVLSLCDVMATKVVDFLARARIAEGRVLLFGGVTRNRFILQFLQDKLPGITFVVPREASSYEAFGASLLAQQSGSVLPKIENLINTQEIGFARLSSLKTALGKVDYVEPKTGKARAGGEYILGIDGGSTTTKVSLIDIETDEVVASHYTRAHGDPVKSFKNCLRAVKQQLHEQIGDSPVNITLAATTGSSREILGVFIETPGVYNEIIAHAVGTTYFRKDVDTIFEIGGQDAKYVYLKNGVPIDYAMNEACSAGTGSFLEESASGDLNITDVREIGDIALGAQAPLKFGEQCSAFINSDIRKAIQLGATREDITAGLITSIVSNYLNRVVGNRSIGKSIALQGGVALNKSIPLAFAMLMDREIIVPPNPELLGCFGVGMLAKQKNLDGLLDKQNFDIDAMLAAEIVYEREFTCKACDNLCPIKVLNVNGHKYMFGGRCNKYTNLRRKKTFDEGKIFNYIDVREELLFETMAPPAEEFVERRSYSVGVPKALSVYTMWPLYSWYFHSLGIRTILSDTISHEGVARAETAYCFPGEIAHGAVQDILEKGADYIFVPHFRDLESYEDHGHATLCPITQALPYYIKKAFPHVPERRFLAPVVTFNYGLKKAEEPFVELGVELGFTREEAQRAFDIAHEKQMEFFRILRQEGQKAIDMARKAERPVIAVLGRPYNAFTKDANMGIPLKFTSRGYSVVPFDMLPFEDAQIFDNMYWYYGQQDMKTASLLRNEDNIYVTWISNFSCAPDSFMLHYVKWLMGSKPFLILELDSHSADAGIDTRVEAFADIIEGYRNKVERDSEERYDNGLRFINNSIDRLHLISEKEDGQRIEMFNNPRVKMLLSNMGRLSTELLATTLKGIGVNAIPLPVPDAYTLQLARNHMSGKECLPSQLVLGAALAFLTSPDYSRDDIYLLFVPTTRGPCRTGQYFVFYENLFRDLKVENVVIVTMDSDNSYNELGASFSRNAWWAIIISDYMKDIETTLRACALNPQEAMETYDKEWHRLLHNKGDLTTILPTLKSVAENLARIPLRKKMEESPKVLIVGEIYVRRDDFAVDELVGMLAAKGIIAKVSGIAEWIYYCDYMRKYEIQKKINLMPWYKKAISPEMKKRFLWEVEQTYKQSVDLRVKNVLKTTGLLPSTPHDMNKIMDNAYGNFVTSELESEISISSGAAATAMQADYSGVINISPFACLIGRVIEGIMTPWTRDLGYPMISVEIDGNILPPNIVNKLEIFMLNVLRFRQEPSIDVLLEKSENGNGRISRKIIRDVKQPS
ncbi:activase [Myxococcota bacterium]|nr:activase [Myxococcota bacterium]